MPNAAQWIAQLLTGQLATIAATIAVAILGLSMLAGRLDKERAIHILAGIALIFGAPAMAAGLFDIVGSEPDSAVYHSMHIEEREAPNERPASLVCWTCNQ